MICYKSEVGCAARAMHWGENGSSAEGGSETRGLSQVDQMKDAVFFLFFFFLIFKLFLLKYSCFTMLC